MLSHSFLKSAIAKCFAVSTIDVPSAVALPTVASRNIIQDLVRVFEVKRLATTELQAARRHRMIQRQAALDDVTDDVIERAAVRKLARDFNTTAAKRMIAGCQLIDETQFRDVDQLQKYLCCKYLFAILMAIFADRRSGGF